MKLFIRYLKYRLRLLFVLALFCLVFAASFLLYHLPLEAVLYPFLLCAGIGLIACLMDFFRARRAHQAMMRIVTLSDAAAAAFPPSDGIQSCDYRKMIRLLCREHLAYRQETGKKYDDMIGYYTVWAHQIKTPIASMRLRLQNEDSALSRRLGLDLRRIEQYADMVMTFLRLNADSTDYVFREYDLDKIVRAAVKKFSSDFIDRRLSLAYEPLDTTVITDEKWLSFVIEQVLSNALKYTPSGCIGISVSEEKILRISDTGIGIAPEDLPRIFENGYTGLNGRADQKASGIGLYLCKRICDRLGHSISAHSTVDVGTVIEIDLSREKIEIE